MNLIGRRPFSQAIAVIALGILLSGCASHTQYRTSAEPCNTSSKSNLCESAILEETKDYLLGFVELDDQGWLWSRDQLKTVLDRLYAEDAKQGLLMLVFVHGWKHNASSGDSNVVMFRKNLSILSRLEKAASRKEGRPARKMVGVYVGWRGLSQNVWGLKNLTFWERKNTAHEVGRGALVELLVRLEDISNNSRVLHQGERKATQLIVVGHSFGGAATYSAIAPILVERMIETIDVKGDAHPPRGFGDLVILINPAFEAARYGVLQDVAEHTRFFTNQPVSLAIFTSKTDSATKAAFPLGRKVSTMFDSYQNSFEKKANQTAVGHFAPYVTHDLIATSDEVKSDEAEVEDSSDKVVSLKSGMKKSAAKKTVSFTSGLLEPRDPTHNPFMPLYVVSVDTKIIPDHNTIDTKPFLTFLREFLLAYTPE